MKYRKRAGPTGAAAAILLVWLGGTLAGCGGGHADGCLSGGEKRFSLCLLPEGGARLAGPHGELWRLPADGLRLGTVAALDELANYDPVPLLLDDPLYTPPPGLEFVSPALWEIERQGADRARVRLVYPGNLEAFLEIQTLAEGRFGFLFRPTTAGAPVAYLRVALQGDAAAGLYGLGGVLDRVEHRGKIRALQLEMVSDTPQESGYNERHVPVPLLVDTRGAGAFFESLYPGVCDAGASAPERVEMIFGTGSASPAGLSFYLFGAEHPLDLFAHYYALTGAPALPARWALGPWVWRDENDDQAQVESDLHAMRDLDLAASALWIDRPYASAVNSFDFRPEQFPDPDAMISLAHRLGFRMGLWHTPYLDPNSAATQALRDEAQTGGYWPPQIGPVVAQWGPPIDLTNAAAYAWWQELIRRYTHRGIEGFKLDYAEEVLVGATGRRIAVWRFADGSDERTMHAGYNRLYHRVYAETLPASGGFLLVRHGSYGEQTLAPIVWPGDLDANMALHGERVVAGGEDYLAVGGLPASLIYGLSLSASGFPFYGSDTGGYRHSPPDEETFIRWFEQTALSTVMQIGTSSNDVAWEMFNAQTDPDGAKLELYRRFTRLHLRLFPYQWTLAVRMRVDGRPIVRPLGLAVPELGQHPDDTYLFGDDLLVAPVVRPGQRERRVLFPPGDWVDFFDGSVHNGPGDETVAAPLEKLPLYLRQGGIVPLLRPTIDTLSPVGDGTADSFDADAGVLYAVVHPGPASRFVLYDGCLLSQERAGDLIRLEYSNGSEFRQGVLFSLMNFGGSPPRSVKEGGVELLARADLAALEASPSGYWYEPARGGILHVKVPAGNRTVEVR
ncbi:MAG: glycoside hydrolase family 31 protein [Myxococcales bacterium]|nr:glycoside hydrolase family 31 protein [Myxococcales bacterium]